MSSRQRKALSTKIVTSSLVHLVYLLLAKLSPFCTSGIFSRPSKNFFSADVCVYCTLPKVGSLSSSRRDLPPEGLGSRSVKERFGSPLAFPEIIGSAACAAGAITARAKKAAQPHARAVAKNGWEGCSSLRSDPELEARRATCAGLRATGAKPAVKRGAATDTKATAAATHTNTRTARWVWVRNAMAMLRPGNVVTGMSPP
mmetsp:Transcript_30374/g.48654  ORF Transcript_30374/g.48654 Transcript_30374/m.48654 type:complete len:201 (-) Transcript_30374:14-616(-)